MTVLASLCTSMEKAIKSISFVSMLVSYNDVLKNCEDMGIYQKIKINKKTKFSKNIVSLYSPLRE